MGSLLELLELEMRLALGASGRAAGVSAAAVRVTADGVLRSACWQNAVVVAARKVRLASRIGNLDDPVRTKKVPGLRKRDTSRLMVCSLCRDAAP